MPKSRLSEEDTDFLAELVAMAMAWEHRLGAYPDITPKEAWDVANHSFWLRRGGLFLRALRGQR
jgi:hypothetical protein